MTDGFLGLVNVEGDVSTRDTLIDQFNLISWASKSIIDVFSKEESFVSNSSTTRVFHNKLRVPEGAANSTGYQYITNNLTLVGGSNISKICFVADFDPIPTGAKLTIEMSCNNGTTYKEIFEQVGGTSASPNLLDQEVTSGFGAGGTMLIRITLTTNSAGGGPTLNHYAIFTDPEPT